MGVAPCRQLHDVDVRLVEWQVLGPYPYRPHELFVFSALKHGAAQEVGEAEFLRRRGLPHAVVAVEVVVERVERTVAQTAGIRLDPIVFPCALAQPDISLM